MHAIINPCLALSWQHVSLQNEWSCLLSILVNWYALIGTNLSEPHTSMTWLHLYVCVRVCVCVCVCTCLLAFLDRPPTVSHFQLLCSVCSTSLCTSRFSSLARPDSQFLCCTRVYFCVIFCGLRCSHILVTVICMQLVYVLHGALTQARPTMLHIHLVNIVIL